MNSECRRSYYPAFFSLLLALLLAFTGCTNAEKSKAEHLAKGDAYLKASKFQEASIEYRNAIQIDDKLAAAHWGLARAYEGQQRFQEAFEELKRTVDLDANNLEARVKLGNYYMQGAKGKPEIVGEAERLAKEILQKDPNNIDGHLLLGSVLFSQGKKDEALAQINQAISLDPKRVESYLNLARFYLVNNESDKAEETFKKAIAINPNSGLAHTEYGRYLVVMNHPAEAEAELSKAVEVEPSNRNSRYVLANYYMTIKQFDKAEQAFRELANLDSDKPDGKVVLADYYASVNRLEDAAKGYQEIIAKYPEFAPARYRLAEILLMRGDSQGALAQLDESLKKDQHDRQALLIRARVRLQSGQPDNIKLAIEDLKEVLRQEPDSRAALYFMAQATYGLGQVDQARTYAGDLERKYPDYLPAKLMAVQIALASSDQKTAITLASQLLDKLDKATPDRDTSPQLLAEIKIKTLLARGTATAQMRDLVSARKDFMAAKEIAPHSADILINLGGVAKAEQKFDEAIAFYEEALSYDSTSPSALGGLIDLYARKNDLVKAHERLDQVINANPNNASLHFLKAQIYGFERNPQASEAELRKTLELDSNFLAAYSALGALFVNTKQEDRAIAEYKKITELRPDNATAYTLIGILEDSRKNYAEAVNNYRKALEKDPNSLIAANNLAWLYAVHPEVNGNLDEAMKLAQGVVQKSPNVAGFVDTLGWVYYHKGLQAAAVEQLQKAVEVDENAARVANSSPSPNYHYHLGMALRAKGDRAAAKKELESALRLAEKMPFPDSDDAKKALATL